ncbi:MAG: response regulator [Actinomycetota bacterium]|nr:response regulator [Actinomycetota bacterium]
MPKERGTEGGPTTIDRIRVLIADDESAVRDALAELIGSDDAMYIAGTAGDADEAIELARNEKPDVALVDVKMPAGGGPRAARGIRDESPQTHVVALSAYEDRRTVLEMLRAGVVGYIVKGTSAEEILYTIRRAMRGQGSLSAEVTADVIHELASLLDHSETLTHELEELNRTKSELIQILSHELFTPITTIQAFAMTVADHGTDLTPEDARALAEGVSSASIRIRRLVGNLAATSRLDRDGVEVSTRPVQVKELLEQAAQDFPSAGERLVLPMDTADLSCRLWADLDLAARALVVLIDNALSFSPEDEPVCVEIRRRGAEVDLLVTDRGPGVPENAREQMFDAFTQVDQSSTRDHEGLGIGLYLAKRIMAAHGGKVAVSGSGGGTTFVLTFLALEDVQAESA